MLLSPHFDSSEFEHSDARISANLMPIFGLMCTEILEPGRKFTGAPLLITSGDRSVAANISAHGQPNSEHVATERYCACDFVCHLKSAREIFDWMRLNPSLPYHQLILESDAHGFSIIHVSINLDKPGVRSVLIGATHNAAPYISADHVPYAPAAPGPTTENA
jgi:hypothetical protein